MLERVALLVVTLAMAFGFPGVGSVGVEAAPCPLSSATNDDGSVWAVWYEGACPVSTAIQDLADKAAVAAVRFYQTMIASNQATSGLCVGQPNPHPNLGFLLEDSDCAYRIMIKDQIDRLADVDNTKEVRMNVDKDILAVLRESGLYTNASVHDDVTVLSTTLGHELFHTIQETANGGQPGWGYWYEGMPRFLQTLIEPAAEADGSSLWTKDAARYMTWPQQIVMGSVPYYVEGPSARPACMGVYDYAPVWASVYNDGPGLAGLREWLDVLAAYEGDPGSGACPAATGDFFAAMAGGASSRRALFLELGATVYARAFSWSDPLGRGDFDFGAALPEVWRLADVEGPVEETVGLQHGVGAWGMQFTILPNVTGYDVTVGEVPAEEWAFQVFVTAEDGTVAKDVLVPGVAHHVAAAGAHEVVVNAIRLAPTTDTWSYLLVPSPP